MRGFVDTVIDSFKQTISLPLWLYFFVVQLIEILVQGLVFLLLLFSVFFVVYDSVAKVGFNNIGLIFTTPSLLAPFAWALGFLFLLFIFVMVYLSSVFVGLRFNLFNGFVKHKRFDLGRAFADTMPRVFTFFKINLVILVLLVLFLGISVLPIVNSVVAIISGLGPDQVAGQVVGIVLYFFLMLLVFGLVSFFLSPLTVLLTPVAFFENFGVVGSFKRAFSLMKSNYLGNLAFVLIYFVVLIGINMAVSFVTRFFAFFTLFPAISSLDVSQSTAAFGTVFSSVILFSFITLAVLVCYVVWAVVFETACFRNLFFLNESLLHSRKPPRRKVGSKRKTK